jgi:hypothetical protein
MRVPTSAHLAPPQATRRARAYEGIPWPLTERHQILRWVNWTRLPQPTISGAAHNEIRHLIRWRVTDDSARGCHPEV